MKEVIINENKKKVKRIIIEGIIFLIISICIFSVGMFEGNLFLTIIGGLVAVLLCIILIFTIKKVINSTPLLIIEKNGITDMSTLSSVGFISWQEIKSINVGKKYGQEYIGITVYDLSKVMKRISLGKQVAMKASLILKYPPVGITALSLNNSDIKFTKVVYIIEKRLEKYRKKK